MAFPFRAPSGAATASARHRRTCGDSDGGGGGDGGDGGGDARA